MKTNWKFKSIVKFMVILLVLSFAGCKDSEDPAPRQAFEGGYEMDDFEVHVFTSDGTDSSFTIPNSSEIEFEIENDLDPDELKVELQEFLEDVITESLKGFGVTFTLSIDVEDDIVVEVSGSEFEMDDHDFDLTLSSGGSTEIFPCKIEGDGEMEGDQLTFDFKILLTASTGTITFEGIIDGEKQ